MAQATVNLKLTPRELQIVDEALQGYTLNTSIDKDPRKLHMMAREVRMGIGLKG
jgi:hypothetical protein